VLCNCQVAQEGFDAPMCSAVIMARPTKSRALFLQMAGRGLRPHAPSKK
jgi:superfamily II DNA or RNA helicase